MVWWHVVIAVVAVVVVVVTVVGGECVLPCTALRLLGCRESVAGDLQASSAARSAHRCCPANTRNKIPRRSTYRRHTGDDIREKISNQNKMIRKT